MPSFILLGAPKGIRTIGLGVVVLAALASPIGAAAQTSDVRILVGVIALAIGIGWALSRRKPAPVNDPAARAHDIEVSAVDDALSGFRIGPFPRSPANEDEQRTMLAALAALKAAEEEK